VKGLNRTQKGSPKGEGGVPPRNLPATCLETGKHRPGPKRPGRKKKKKRNPPTNCAKHQMSVGARSGGEGKKKTSSEAKKGDRVAGEKRKGSGKKKIESGYWNRKKREERKGRPSALRPPTLQPGAGKGGEKKRKRGGRGGIQKKNARRDHASGKNGL